MSLHSDTLYWCWINVEGPKHLF